MSRHRHAVCVPIMTHDGVYCVSGMTRRPALASRMYVLCTRNCDRAACTASVISLLVNVELVRLIECLC